MSSASVCHRFSWVQNIYEHFLATEEWIMVINYFLSKGGYVFGSVGLFAYLFVTNITQKVMHGLE